MPAMPHLCNVLHRPHPLLDCSRHHPCKSVRARGGACPRRPYRAAATGMAVSPASCDAYRTPCAGSHLLQCSAHQFTVTW